MGTFLVLIRREGLSAGCSFPRYPSMRKYRPGLKLCLLYVQSWLLLWPLEQNIHLANPCIPADFSTTATATFARYRTTKRYIYLPPGSRLSFSTSPSVSRISRTTKRRSSFTSMISSTQAMKVGYGDLPPFNPTTFRKSSIVHVLAARADT